MLKFNVRNQSISRIDNFRPAEKSIKYLLAQFDFKTEDWKETVKTAVFRNEKTGKTYDAILDGNVCVVPWEALSESGVCEVSVYGIKDDGSRITTDIDVVNLNSTIYGGSATQEPSPTVYETLVLGIDKLENKVGKLEDEIENFEPSQPSLPGGNIIVDSELSEESKNPVQNKVIAQKFGELSQEIDDLKNGLPLETTIELSKNLFNYNERKVDSLPNSWEGSTMYEFSNLNGFITSSLIEVEGGKKYCLIETDTTYGTREFATSYITDFYTDDGVFLTKVESSLNPYVEAPSNAKYMYMFSSVKSTPFCSETGCIMEYYEGMDKNYVPYGETRKTIFKENTKYGLFKNGSDYYHFTKINDEDYLIRHFKQMGVNNLFQLYGIMKGVISNNTLAITETIGTTGTDNVGPISIHRGEVDGYGGGWSGGVHGRTVDGVEYPTAQQIALEIYCNGEKVTEDGLYYGKVTVKTTNDLYFPKTITGDDLTSSVKAIKETRVYTLTDKMNVKVTLEFYNECFITQYMGCQCVTYGMETLKFPNNEVIVNITNNSYVGAKKESVLIAEKGNAHYEVSVKPYGLGTFEKNTGTESGVGYCYLATFDKFYFVLIANELNQVRKGTPDTIMCWEADYNYYFD